MTIFRKIISLVLALSSLMSILFIGSVSADAVNTQYGLCIIEIADNEVGYTETSGNITKYGEWYGWQTSWCAIFVSWCASQAGISESVIPKTAGPSVFTTFYSQLGSYYKSPSRAVLLLLRQEICISQEAIPHQVMLASS